MHIAGQYTQEELYAVLASSEREWHFEYELLNKQGVHQRFIKVISAKVSNNALATKVKRTAEFLIPYEELPALGLTDKLRVYVYLHMPDGLHAKFVLGTFQLMTDLKKYDSIRRLVSVIDQTQGTESVTTVKALNITGYDDLITLDEDAVLDRYVVTAGTQYRAAIMTLLTTVGMTNNMIETTATTLPADMEWPPGTSKLTIINNLLSSINYTSLRMSPMGVPTSGAYQSPKTASPLYSYKVDRSSVIVPGIDVELDLWNIPNTWVAFVSEPDRPMLRSVVVNSDPSSPLSTVSRGRTIVQIVEPDRQSNNEEYDAAATQAILDAKVARVAEESGQLYEHAKFSTSLMPIHDHADVCYIDYGEGNFKFRETSWSIELKVGGTMQHEFRRVVMI